MDKQIKAQQYADKHYNGIRKKCLCGCGQETNYNNRNKDLADYMQGHLARTSANPTKGTKGTPEAKEHMRKAYEKRKSDLQTGGAIQWNKGLTSETDERVKAYSEKQIGKAVTDEFRENQSRLMNGRIKKMKDEGTYEEYVAKQLLMINKYWEDPKHRLEQRHRTTERLIRDNYSMKSSKEEEIMKIILEDLGVDYQFQFNLEGKLFDFCVGNTIIEVMGNFHHADPIKWPNGPIYPIQIRSVENDKIKKEIALRNNYKIVYIWAEDIIKDQTFEIIKGLI